jgi:hypothetical protein
MQEDSPTSRAQFEQWMERRRVEETDAEALQVLRRGWCLGSESLRREMLLRMDGKLGDHHSGELHRARGNRAYDQRSCQKWPKLWADPCYGIFIVCPEGSFAPRRGPPQNQRSAPLFAPQK